jgi:hypothetical protein
VFDFGTGINVYMFLAPQNGANGKVRFAITTTGWAGEQIIDGQSALATGAWSHVAITRSGNTGILYVNGEEVGRNSAMTLKPSSLGHTMQNYLGKSQHPDPYFNGAIDDFRLYGTALNAGEIASLAVGPLAAPQNLAATPGGSVIALTWNAVSGASGYTVRRAAAVGGPYTDRAVAIPSTTYTDSGLSAGATWYYTVFAQGLSGAGVVSAPVSATTYTASQSWRLAHFGATGATGTAADDADPDGDGRLNLLEYALGGNPLVSDALPAPVAAIDESGHMTLGFARIADPALLYEVQAGDDLTAWSTFWSSTGVQNTPGPVTVTDPEPTSAHPRRFLRLSVGWNE